MIKFNWKGKSYYVSTTKVEKNEANNNIAWVFYKDEKLTQGQKVAVLGSIGKPVRKRTPKTS